MKHTLSILVFNQPGVLMRVAGMFSRRGFNIDSLAVGVTHVPEYSRITAVMAGSDAVVNQVVKQLEKLVEVKYVKVLPPNDSVVRGLAMIKVKVDSKERMEVVKLAEIFRGKVVDISDNTLTIEITGYDSKIDALLEVLAKYEILEMTRTGVIGIDRGETTLYNSEHKNDDVIMIQE